MKRLLIIWHSLTGGSEAMARAAAEAAHGEDVDVVLLPAAEAGPDDLVAGDGYIFVCPENLAAIAGVMKAFFDRTYYPALGKIEGRPYAILVCAGTDGENAVRQIARIATGWRLKVVAEPVIVLTHADTPEAILAPKTIPPGELARCSEVGRLLAAGIAMGIF